MAACVLFDCYEKVRRTMYAAIASYLLKAFIYFPKLFNCVLNAPLAGNGRESSSLKNNLKSH